MIMYNNYSLYWKKGKNINFSIDKSDAIRYNVKADEQKEMFKA